MRIIHSSKTNQLDILVNVYACCVNEPDGCRHTTWNEWIRENLNSLAIGIITRWLDTVLHRLFNYEYVYIHVSLCELTSVRVELLKKKVKVKIFLSLYRFKRSSSTTERTNTLVLSRHLLHSMDIVKRKLCKQHWSTTPTTTIKKSVHD